MQRLDLQTPDFTSQNIARLAELFPNCVTEKKSPDGTLRRAIDTPADEKGLSLKDVVGAASAEIERAIIVQTLRRADGNKAQCARWLQVDYKTIQSKLKLYEIS